MTPIQSLDSQLKAIAPILGVSIGRWEDKTTWRVLFQDEVTDQQRKDAENFLQSFDPASVVEIPQPSLPDVVAALSKLTVIPIDGDGVIPIAR